MTPPPHRLSVAPMMDWTDRHCRAFHRALTGRALLYTEMVTAPAVVHGDRARLLGFDAVEHPVALQLGGSDPDQLAQAARIGAAMGYDEINLNVGCPSDRVQSGRFGACLMREPGLVADCMAAIKGAVAVPATVKCRIGVDDQEPEISLFATVDACAAVGVTTFIVHARKAWLSGLSPKENRDIPPLRYDWVHRLKQERPALRISLNGGLATVEACVEQLARVDAVMIGRMAYHEPYKLHLLDCALSGREPRRREDLLRDYLPYVQRHLDKGLVLKHITRHILGLYHAQAGGRAYRQILSEGAPRSDAGLALVEKAIAVTQAPERAA